jgi:hypothetical protein
MKMKWQTLKAKTSVSSSANSTVQPSRIMTPETERREKRRKFYVKKDIQ